MKFQTRLKIGDVLDNKALCDEFKVANMGALGGTIVSTNNKSQMG